MKIKIILIFIGTILSSPVHSLDIKEAKCLAKTIYWESRGERLAGQFAVAGVVLNRVNDDKFPNTICDVVHQKNPIQFSKAIVRNLPIKEHSAWEHSLDVAKKILKEQIVIPESFTALYFDVKSGKVPKHLNFHSTIGNHKFYSQE